MKTGSITINLKVNTAEFQKAIQRAKKQLLELDRAANCLAKKLRKNHKR